MNNKNFLITGGAGFIGFSFVHPLIEWGEKITIYDIPRIIRAS